MKNKIWIIIFIAVTTSATIGSGINLNYVDVCINKKCFASRIADTPQSRVKGLMNQDRLPIDEGLLFIFNEYKVHEFWMKNMNFPLDIIFINDEHIISTIIKNAPPCNKDKCEIYKPKNKSLMALEINAGLCEKHAIKIGQSVEFYIEDDE